MPDCRTWNRKVSNVEIVNMPNKDGMGPTGHGPMTGRGSGKCVIPLNTIEEELNYLKNQREVLREQLESVETRLRVLEPVACKDEK